MSERVKFLEERARLLAELNEGDGVYYITEERAFAPGISGEWPAVIPHSPHGRLVKRTWPRPPARERDG